MTAAELVRDLVASGWQPYDHPFEPSGVGAMLELNDVELYVSGNTDHTYVTVTAQYWHSWQLIPTWQRSVEAADAREAVRHGEMVILKRMAMTFDDYDPETT